MANRDETPLRPTLVPWRERWMGLRDFGTMWATDKDVPYLDSDQEPVGTWVGIGEFSGDVIPRNANNDPLPGLVSGTWVGPTALTVVGEDLLGIVAPEDTSEPTVWFWVASHVLMGFGADAELRGRSVVTITADGWVGSAHEPDRPFQGWSLRIRDVTRLKQPCWTRTLHETIALEVLQETSLLDALRNLPAAGTRDQPLPEVSVQTDQESVTSSTEPPRAWVEKLSRQRAPISGAILRTPLEPSGADGRRARRVGRLAIACAIGSGSSVGPGGVPFSESGEEAIGSWAAIGLFVGSAELLDEEGVLHAASEVVMGGTCTLTLTEERLIAILDSDPSGRQLVSQWADMSLADMDQSLWISAPRSSLTFEASGQQGTFGKRPVQIAIHTGGSDLYLREILKFTRPCTRETAERRNSAQPRAESSVVEALSK